MDIVEKIRQLEIEYGFEPLELLNDKAELDAYFEWLSNPDKTILGELIGTGY